MDAIVARVAVAAGWQDSDMRMLDEVVETAPATNLLVRESRSRTFRQASSLKRSDMTATEVPRGAGEYENLSS